MFWVTGGGGFSARHWFPRLQASRPQRIKLSSEASSSGFRNLFSHGTRLVPLHAPVCVPHKAIAVAASHFHIRRLAGWFGGLAGNRLYVWPFPSKLLTPNSSHILPQFRTYVFGEVYVTRVNWSKLMLVLHVRYLESTALQLIHLQPTSKCAAWFSLFLLANNSWNCVLRSSVLLRRIVRYISTFRDNLSFLCLKCQAAPWLLKMGWIGCLETSLPNYQKMLRKSPEEPTHLYCRGNLNSPKLMGLKSRMHYGPNKKSEHEWTFLYSN